MSNYLAIATVTATFGLMIGEALEPIPRRSELPRVRFGPPQPDPEFAGCSIFLSGVSRNAVRNKSVLDVTYLLTFTGDEETLEPQRFLGAVVSGLQAQPIMPREAITRCIGGFDYLRESDLDQAPDQIRIAQAALDLAVLAELWQSFSPVRYCLTIAYTAAGIVT